MKTAIKSTGRILALSALAAALLWPVVDRQINYQFKSLPQYLKQEWVWWVKTTK